MKKFLNKRNNDTELLELSNHLDHFIEEHEILIQSRAVSCQKCNIHGFLINEPISDEELRIQLARAILDDSICAAIPALYRGKGGWMRNLFPSVPSKRGI
jgi:hypothetical protein